VEGPSVVLGLGLSYNLFDSLEIYSSLSSTQMVQLFTALLGMRYAVSKKLQAGALLMYSNPGLLAAEVTIGTQLGK